MSTNRIIRIIVGLALIGVGLYSGIVWFYLGVIPLVMGIVNWCPLEMKLGTCDPASGCCSSTPQATSESACCAPKSDATANNITSFKAVPSTQNGTTVIEILGTGCSKCVALEKVVNEAIKSLDGNYEVKKVSNLDEIMAYNVVSTPGLVVNGTVVSTGKLLSVDEVKKILQTS